MKRRNKRNTKSALIGSLLITLLCCSMLLGTTFAWFVDSETAQVGTIQSGRLSFQLEYALQPNEGGKLVWHEARNAEATFGEDALWEPGYTGVVYIRVTNTGSLAMKYRCSVQTVDNVIGTNQNGGSINLLQFVKVGATGPVTDAFKTRDEALAAAEDNMTLLSNHVAGRADGIAYSTDFSDADEEAVLSGTNDCQIFAVVVNMPSSTGNEANYSGEPAPSFKLRITVDAAQAPVESDSSGSDYDSTASYAPETTADTQLEETLPESAAETADENK